MRVYQLDIYRPGIVPELVGNVNIDKSTQFQKEFMGMDKIVVESIVPTQIKFAVDDYIEYMGDKYALKYAPGVLRYRHGYKHSLTFYSPLFDWYDMLIKHLDATEFSFTGTPFEFMTLLLDNVQDFYPEWQLGDVSLIDEPKTLSFSNQSCYAALFQIANEFGLEFNRTGKIINLVESVGQNLPITFEYGRGKGLYTLARKSVDEAFATEWYGFGGTQNLPVGYRSGIGRLGLDNPVQKNVDIYGRKQGTVAFDHIYPRYTGEVTSIDGEQVIFDTGIDFPITPVADGSAKIVFKTGSLGGNEFTITGWDEGTGKVTFGTKKEESGYVLPNDAVHAEVGDTYTIVGVVMPSQYVIDAEAELLAATQGHASKNSHPKVAYDLEMDQHYIYENGLTGVISPGDSIEVIDTNIGTKVTLRIQNVSWPLVSPGAITANIAEVLLYTYQERIAKDARTAKSEASNAQKGAIYSRRVADEIANAVIINQFERTYVGDRAVLTGVFVAGNPDDGDVAGMSGEGSLPTSIRFWGGGSYDNRASAPFRVQQNGEMWATAGYIGGFNILGNSLESAQEYNGGKFVLYPNNGFIAFLNPSESVWAGIGENVLPSSAGIRAVGRFENTKSDILPNMGMLVNVSGSATSNIAVKATGAVAVDGPITQTNLYIFTPVSGVGNTLSMSRGNNAIVLVDDAGYSTVYLPEPDEIATALGLGTTADFCVRYTVSVHYSSLNSLIASSYDMRDHNGTIISSTAQNKGDCSEWFIFRESGVVTAQMLNRQAI